MKNSTIEIHGVQACKQENKPNIILEFPSYSDKLVTEISFFINLPAYQDDCFYKYQYYSFSVDYKAPSIVFLSIPCGVSVSFILDNFPKAEKFKFTKTNRDTKENTICGVSNIWSERNRTMFLDYYPEYLLPKP